MKATITRQTEERLPGRRATLASTSFEREAYQDSVSWAVRVLLDVATTLAIATVLCSACHSMLQRLRAIVESNWVSGGCWGSLVLSSSFRQAT
ncbi:hypothetical protein BDR03DRAFT_964891 [Suillus americanus]|nr:hypothetical protein BDR03DRAFT_964891 [Suillus americanus]